MADINGLKLMNDAFSHDAGDELLVKASQAMTKHFNTYGEVYRIGGDEFVILLPNSSDQFTNQLINELNSDLSQTAVKGVSISVSFGYSTAYHLDEVKQVARKAEENMYAHKIASISSNRNLLIKTLQKTLYEKNPREEAHCKRVSVVSKALGLAIGLDSEQLGLLEVISFLHDIGKIAIDEEVLNKTDQLSTQEWEKVKKHPEIGYRILSTVPEYFEVASDILSHHERYDGHGYPRGLKGEQIPLRARILSIADAYDAMVNKRPYNEQKTHEAAMIEIKENRGTQFDPILVDVFIKHFGSKPFFQKKNETYKK
jgi:diguanylate cyclase (GGDEF)-like protein